MLGCRLVFLRKQADIVAQREESLVLALPLQHEVVREPKAALVVDDGFDPVLAALW
jgi:hypothetical protein